MLDALLDEESAAALEAVQDRGRDGYAARGRWPSYRVTSEPPSPTDSAVVGWRWAA